MVKFQEDIETPARAKWGGKLEFLMSCIAMSVGLGNIWRFPFIAYENGGGAFLIPYIIVLLLMGRPVYYMEMCLGQFSSRANVKMFEAMAPILKGNSLKKNRHLKVIQESLVLLFSLCTTRNCAFNEIL